MFRTFGFALALALTSTLAGCDEVADDELAYDAPEWDDGADERSSPTWKLAECNRIRVQMDDLDDREEQISNEMSEAGCFDMDLESALGNLTCTRLLAEQAKVLDQYKVLRNRADELGCRF